MEKYYKIFFGFLVIFALIFFIPLNLVDAITQSDNYIIFADVFSSGGSASSTSDLYGLADTIGEAMILSATSTSDSYGVKAGFQELYPDQYLSFSINSTSLDFGEIVDSAVSTASNQMTIDTNAPLGFTVTVSGATLTSGSDTIDAIGATAAASSAGTEQFGLNLVSNSSPVLGADPSGTAPIGSVAGQYGTANSFAFQTGDTVASASNDINETVYTVSYIANITSDTPDGTYSTTLTYSVTANF